MGLRGIIVRNDLRAHGMGFEREAWMGVLIAVRERERDIHGGGEGGEGRG